MATKTAKHDKEFDRPSGVPEAGKLGESKGEMFALIAAVVLMALIVVAFWWEATH